MERDIREPLRVPAHVCVVGRGRLGTALGGALRAAGVRVSGPTGRGEAVPPADAVVLCVPDAEIPAAARAAAAAAPVIGHTSGATPLGVIAAALDDAAAFGLHPLQTFTGGDPPERFHGAGCAIAGTSDAALATARGLAQALGMRPFAIEDRDRGAYHAAASIASNFLVTLEAAAEDSAGAAGIDPATARELLAPLVRSTVDNWAAHGPASALTGPVARGDDHTVVAQRAALATGAPHLLPLFDALVEATRALAGRSAAPAPRQEPGDRSGMATVRTVSALRAALAPHRRLGATVGLVPTMGFFHAGHLALMRRAREQCDVVVVSLFVNPAQFGAGEDLEDYPRDEARDAALAEAEGVDLLFAPPVEEVYPEGFATKVRVESLTEVLCGDQARRGREHFDGVTTVVTKLLNMASPDVAYFGQKDAQQALVIRKLVRDLDMPVRIEVCPTVREPDGLAMSSRNAYLDAAERARAAAISHALEAAARAVARGERSAAGVLAAAKRELADAGIEPEYLELRSTTDLSPVERVNGSTLLAVAAHVGRARLIDNKVLGGTT